VWNAARCSPPPERLRRPGISLIAPAYNVAPIIEASARALLAADYDPLEVVIVDDGSEDGTTAALDRAFDLVEMPVGDRMRIETQPVRRYDVSRNDPRLRVLQKENGGRSDAVNAGLNVAHLELVAIVDADTLLERDALKRIVEVFAADPDDVVAVGGTVRVANGAVIEHNAVTVPHVARGGTEASQTAEYLRSFLAARIAWSALNGLLIISGAFGVFRRDLVRDSGGLSRETLGEDMEMVMRLHHQLRPQRPRTIPVALGPLRGQRIRWHVGLFDNLRIHRRMIGRRRFGAVGLWSLPHELLFEAAGPLLQAVGMVLVVGWPACTRSTGRMRSRCSWSWCCPGRCKPRARS
jgi:cellulose synthase/poly-beta-1,6-N-acetylglucosamine synthase-like glycosyltransferase